ncbi:MAG: hypothetical protein M1835_001410 [Candelina submexicana]|nr:MAG: hypothetical protein M1835_001410 [Candelina submexicana]
MPATATNGVLPPDSTPSITPIELSFPLPKSPNTTVHLHLTNHTTSLLLFLTTTTGEPVSTPSSLGSFVYAMPDRTNTRNVLSTPLYTRESSLESATRLAKLLARKMGKPVYVGSSISFAGGGMGGTVEEEMEGFERIVQVVLGTVGRSGEARNGV